MHPKDKQMSVIYLIPTPISENSLQKVIPEYVISIIKNLDQFVVENIRHARRYLAKIEHPVSIDKIKFIELNKHTTDQEFENILPFIRSADTGILSEAGVPCVADPGSKIVRLAHANSISVIPLVGPSSILLALMASGLNGQSFSFIGYLPVARKERLERIKKLERTSGKKNETQIFIETPYRNMQLLIDVINCCNDETFITIASDITGSNQLILTKRVKQWKKMLPELNKIPTIFLLQA